MTTRRAALGAIFVAGAGMAMERSSAAGTANTQNDMTAPARSYIEGWNAHDMATMRATLAPDAEWVNVVGMHWRGRDQIMFAHAAMHAGMFRENRLELQSITSRRLGPEVAILLAEFIQGAYQVPNGPTQPRALDRLTLVVVRGPEGWRIVHGHNTIVDEHAAPNDPVLRMEGQKSLRPPIKQYLGSEGYPYQ